jgi:hypothetical protein
MFANVVLTDSREWYLLERIIEHTRSHTLTHVSQSSQTRHMYSISEMIYSTQCQLLEGLLTLARCGALTDTLNTESTDTHTHTDRSNTDECHPIQCISV